MNLLSKLNICAPLCITLTSFLFFWSPVHLSLFVPTELEHSATLEGPNPICLDHHTLIGSGEFYQMNWSPTESGWVEPPTDPMMYPYTQTVSMQGTTITADVTLSHPTNDTNTLDENYACPAGCAHNVNNIDHSALLGQDTIFRFWKSNADQLITMTMVFSEPILVYELGMGGPNTAGGGTILSVWDDSISIDGNQNLDVLTANVVLPNSSVHPSPGVNTFYTATDDPALESTVNYYAHDNMSNYSWGVSGDITNAAPAPINYLDEYVGLGPGTGGDILLGQENGFYYNISRDNKRSWVTVDYAGMSVKSISWQLFREDLVAFDAAIAGATATIGDYVNYLTNTNRSAYFAPFTFQTLACPGDEFIYCVDGTGPTNVNLSADPTKTSNVIWYNSANIQVGTGATLNVSNATLGMADGNETFTYTGTDIASGCAGYSCCPFSVSAVTCCPTLTGFTNQTCSDNSTPLISTDDYISFDLDPTGFQLNGNYNVSISSGSILPTTAAYGVPTTFQLQSGSIGAGDVTLTITDAIDPSCTLDTIVVAPNECVLFDLEKTADKSSAEVGDTIFYTYTITNNGLDPLTLSDITDDKLGAIATQEIGTVRVTDQLQALWRFEDATSTTISDNSGVLPNLDLAIVGSNFSWGADSLDFTGANRAENTTNNNKLHTSITASGELTVEAWIQPDNNTQAGASRIISQSLNNTNRNWQLMQNGSRYEFRLRTSDHGTNEAETNLGVISTSPTLQHVVYTFDGTTAQFYINGAAVYTSGAVNPTGDFTTWDPNYDLALGNENSVPETDTDRDWQGEFHLLAVYSKALSIMEVMQNYTEGTGPAFVDKTLANSESATYSAFYEVTGSEPIGPYKNIADVLGIPITGPAMTAIDSASVYLGCIIPSCFGITMMRN